MMKTILISDINGKSESVLPYALNFTKHINNSIQVIHVVDPRKQHAVSSAYADSQSFEVGRKLTHTEIMEKEKQLARLSLEKMLSREASKLNFPLRVNSIVEENSIFNRLNAEVEPDEPFIMITSSAFEDTIFNDFSELVESTNKFNNLTLIVPPGYSFAEPLKTIVYHDFSIGENVSIFKLLSTIKSFKHMIDVVDVADASQYAELEIEGQAWLQKALDSVGKGLHIASMVLTGKQFVPTLLDFIQGNNYDMVAIPLIMRVSSGLKINTVEITGQIINQLSIPVILY